LLDGAPSRRETLEDLQSATVLGGCVGEDDRAVRASISNLDVKDRSVDPDLHFDGRPRMDDRVGDQLADQQHCGLTVPGGGP
jgi:hypothetical protein